MEKIPDKEKRRLYMEEQKGIFRKYRDLLMMATTTVTNPLVVGSTVAANAISMGLNNIVTSGNFMNSMETIRKAYEAEQAASKITRIEDWSFEKSLFKNKVDIFFFYKF